MNTPLGRALQTLLIVLASIALAVLFILFLGRIHTVATVVVGAVFLCYLIHPAVRRLNRRLPLWASILIVYVVVLGVVALILAFAVPAVAANIRQFVHDAPALVQTIQAWIANPNNPVLAHLPSQARAYIEQIPAELAAFLSKYGGEAAGNLLHVLLSTAAVLALFIIIPVVAIYMMLDLNNMHRGFLGLLPAQARPKAEKILVEIDGVLGGFVRGQLLVAAIVGILIIVMLSLLHVRYAIVIGIVAGLLEIIPYVGAFAGAVPAILIAWITNGTLDAVLVVAGFVAINQLEGHVISPLVVSGKVGLSPLAIVLALLTGGELFGLPGLFLAVPVAGTIRVLLSNLVPGERQAAGPQT